MARLFSSNAEFLPVRIAEPLQIRAFRDHWIAWFHESGIDCFIRGTLAVIDKFRSYCAHAG
jgi:hypothetical protein